MKSALTLSFIALFLVTLAQDSSKLYRFTFRAGAATGLNIYEPATKNNIREYSFDKASFGTGLGTELSYKAVKWMDVVAHYYFYVYKNKVDFPAVLLRDFALKQQSHMLAFSADFKLYESKRTKISIGAGPGFALSKDQYVLTNASTGDVLHVGERQYAKFVAPLYVGMESYVKGYLVLGIRAQTFFWGTEKPVRSLNVFSYLGMRF